MVLKSLVKLPYVCLVVFSKIAKANRFSLSQKVSLFFTMIHLWVRATLTNNSDHLIQSKVLHFSISAYGYHTLFYLLDEIFLKGIYHFESKSDTPTIVDCGANIGISALYFKFLYPNSAIVCFEPNPSVFDLLRLNVQQNRLENVELHNIALSDKEQLLDFYVGDEKGSFISSTDNARGGTKIEVSAKLLSSILANKKVDLIKIDVEGSEWEIIQDLNRNHLLGATVQYIIEYHHNLSDKNAQLGHFLGYFENKNYQYTLTSEYENIGDFQCVMLYILTK